MNNLEVRLNITNYNLHPEKPNYTVFHYYNENMANHFEKLLIEAKIPFEKAIEEGEQKLFLFGILNIYYSKAVRLNFIAIGKYRERFIPQPFLAYLLLGFVLLLIVIAMIGYFKS